MGVFAFIGVKGTYEKVEGFDDGGKCGLGSNSNQAPQLDGESMGIAGSNEHILDSRGLGDWERTLMNACPS